MDGEEKLKPESDLGRLLEMLHDPDGVAKMIDQRMVNQQFQQQNRWLKAGFGILSSLLVIAVCAVVNDHYTLQRIVDQVVDMQRIQKEVLNRNQTMWFEGKYNERHPGLNP